MKSNFNCFRYIFHSCIPISSKSISFFEMDCLSRTFCLCFLTVKTVQIFGSRIPILSRARFFRRSEFVPHFCSISTESTAQRDFVPSSSKTVMGKNKTFPENSPKKKLKVEAAEEKEPNENGRKRPNYFVAVQISNPDIHDIIQRIQDHIVAQNIQFKACMNSIATLHITLMVMSITDVETHQRALNALHSVHEEYNEEMCKDPLKLEFCSLGHFKNRVLYAKIKENDSYKRLCVLAKCVRKHFADFGISSTDQREFNPHLTIAKIDFSKKKQRALKKIDPSLYETFVKEYIGSETIVGIQLLSMTNSKNDAGYYVGHNLIFESNIPSRKTSTIEINEKKEDIRKKIANLAQKIFK